MRGQSFIAAASVAAASLVASTPVPAAAGYNNLEIVFSFYNHTPHTRYGVVQGIREVQIPPAANGSYGKGEIVYHHTWTWPFSSGGRPFTVNIIPNAGSGDTFCDYAIEVKGYRGIDGYEMTSCSMTKVKSGSGSHQCNNHNDYSSMRENKCYFPFSLTQ